MCPAEMTGFRYIESVFREQCTKWGYREVRTPTLEYLHLFTSAGTLTPDRLNRVYSFLDWDGWSGERVVLKPDSTIPVARLYIDSMAQQKVVRLAYVGNTFIFEPTGNQDRERWQCGVELIGEKPPFAEIELLLLIKQILQQLGLDGFEIRLSHAGVMRALLERTELKQPEELLVFERLLNGEDEALKQLAQQKPELQAILPLLAGLKGCNTGFLKNLKAMLNGDFPQLSTALDDFLKVVAPLEEMGVSYHIDLTSGKDFEYYTGVIFQIFRDGVKIGGGGRYDALIPQMGGAPTGASGFALYMEKLTSQLPQEVLIDKTPHIYLKLDDDLLQEVLKIADELRDAGIIAELYNTTPPATARWLLELNENGEGLITDKIKNKQQKVDDVSAMLALLGDK